MRSTVVRSRGSRPGVSTSRGCRSNVTATDRIARSRARSTVVVSTARWPRCTPSKKPTVTTEGSSGQREGLEPVDDMHGPGSLADPRGCPSGTRAGYRYPRCPRPHEEHTWTRPCRTSTTTKRLGHRHGRLRRPSGEAPPLPREAGWTRWIWVGAGVVLVGAALYGVMYGEPGTPLAIDVSILRWAEGLRTTVTVDIAKVINSLASVAAILVLRWIAILVLAFYRRWRHLAVALLTWAVMDLIATQLRVELLPPPSLKPPIPVIDGPTVNGVLNYYWPGAAFVALSITCSAWCSPWCRQGRARRFAAASWRCSRRWVVLASCWRGSIRRRRSTPSSSAPASPTWSSSGSVPTRHSPSPTRAVGTPRTWISPGAEGPPSNRRCGTSSASR